MYIDRTCNTIMYNYNKGMYHKPRHKLYYTGNIVIAELNSIINGKLETSGIYVQVMSTCPS